MAALKSHAYTTAAVNDHWSADPVRTSASRVPEVSFHYDRKALISCLCARMARQNSIPQHVEWIGARFLSTGFT
jgi:hypothetical protein